MQQAAQQAVRDGLAAYERRHGWKGNLLNVVANGESIATYHHVDWDADDRAGQLRSRAGDRGRADGGDVKFGNYEARLGPEEIKWTRHKSPQEFLSAGDIVYVKVDELNGASSRVSLEQESGVQGALLALDNSSGDVKAMIGGRDFEQSKFNRATQALRQVGSSFKPYIYTAAIDQGLTPDDTVLDAPITFNTPSGPYTPHNYDGKFEGVITFRHALAESRNIPALKVTERVGGIKTVIEYARRFGITSPIPPYLPVALGAADITLTEQTAAFTTFPNDGVRVTPRYIRKVTDYDGRVLEENYPEVSDVVSARTARIMVTMLREVVLHGTGIPGEQAQSSAGRQDRHHQRLHRRMVRRASRRRSPAACGWASTRRRRWATRKPAPWRRCRSGWTSCAWRSPGRESEDFAAPPPTARACSRAEGRHARRGPRATARPTDASLLSLLLRVLVLIVVFMASALLGDALRHSRSPDDDSQSYRPDADPGSSDCSPTTDSLLEQGDRYFSSDVPPGRVMSQAPAPGVQVRRGWHVRVAESMGPQRVVIPDLIGNSERAAEINIRRRGLELGSIATGNDPRRAGDQIVAQSPPANAVNVSEPKISLLIAAPAERPSFVMPDLVGQREDSAIDVIVNAGLRVAGISTAAPAQANAPQAVPAGTRMVVKTTPAAGQRVFQGQGIGLEVTQ